MDEQKVIDMFARHHEEALDMISELCELKPELTTPTGIKFWVGESSGKVQGLLFNDGQQMLMYCHNGGVFEVSSMWGVGEKDGGGSRQENLPLTPCRYEDLKPGEFFSIRKVPECINDIRMKLPKKKDDAKNVAIESGEDPITYIDKGPHNVWKIGKQ